MEIKFVSKDELAPRFGYWQKEEIRIREDLPKCVKSFIAAHEVYHGIDKPGYWLWREIKASTMPLIGLLVLIVLSLSPSRIKYYIRRFKEGK